MQKYGGFWIRLGAVCIDSVVMLIPILVIRRLTFATLPSNMHYVVANLISEINQTMAWWVYFAALESSQWQATIGKMVCGLVVVDEYGNRISFARATGRYFAKGLSTLILGIGFLMIAFTRRKQGLHDMLAGTLVLKNQPASATAFAENNSLPPHNMSPDMKKCPYCAETIKREARKCRFCGEIFGPDATWSDSDSASRLARVCPQCNYERDPKDDEFTPKTECPRCGVIYGKFAGSRW